MGVEDPISVTLATFAAGDKSALDTLMPALYTELKRIAQGFLAHERPDHTLQPTALVHEAYLRLVGQHQVNWSCRAQIVGMAATMMRRILVNHARSRAAFKRDHGSRVPLTDDLALTQTGELDVQQLNLTLDTLAEIDARQARIVELRFFSGLTIEETAAVLELSTATVKREWRMARLWLLRELDRGRA